MKRYFVCADIHGFYDELISALSKAGYDKNNEEHYLIVLGDVFDRGKKPYEVFKFLTSIPKDRLVLVKGNHEELLLELVKRKFPYSHDISNGTYETLMLLSRDPYEAKAQYMLEHKSDFSDRYELYEKANEVFAKVEKELYCSDKLFEILDWITSDDWRDYYELGKYIFVHAFIPLVESDDDIYHRFKYYPDWRTSSSETMWYDARWGCPYALFQEGYFDEEAKKGKILVCGHWYTSDFYNHLLYEKEPEKWLDYNKTNPIFKSDKYPNLIGIDASTALTKVVNVLVIDESNI